MPTPGVDIGPFPNILTQSDVVAWLDGWDHVDVDVIPFPDPTKRTVFARNANRLVAAMANVVAGLLANQTDIGTLQTQMAARIAEAAAEATHLSTIDAQIAALQSSSSSGYRFDVTKAPYNCVADGTANNIGTSHDNKGTSSTSGFEKALADAATFGFEVYVPGDVQGRSYDVYMSDVVVGTSGGFIGVSFANARITGDGWNRSIIRGISVKTARGQVGAISGDTVTMAVHSDASKFKAQCTIHASPNSDMSNKRSEPSGPASLAANGNSTTGVVTFNTGHVARLSGLAVGDYLSVDYGFAVFKHTPGADCNTVPYDLTFKDVSVTAEWYGSTLDGTSSNDATKDTNNHCFYLEPRPNTISVKHTLLFERVKVSGAYNGLTVSGGGSGAHAYTKLHLKSCDVQGGVIGCFASTNADWAGKWYVAENTYFHDTDLTVGSHLNYINSQINIAHLNCEYDNWRAGKYALQHWGTANLYPESVKFTNCWFKSGGLGFAVLTNEHSTCELIGCTFSSTGWVEMRTSTTIKGGIGYMKPGGYGFSTYADCQAGAHIDIEGFTFNMAYVGLTPPAGCVIVDHAVHMSIRSCKSISITQAQDTSAVPVSVNAGNFLVVHSTSVGGYVHVEDLQMTQDTANTNSQAILAFLASAGADVKIANSRYTGRTPTVGVVRIDGRTSGRVELNYNDFDVVGASGHPIFGSVTTAVNILSGWGNRFHGRACTFVGSTQRLQARAEMGPDVAATSTVTWDPDYDRARITDSGSTTIDTINLPGSGQLGYDGMSIDWLMPATTTLGTGGNIQGGRAPAAGRVRLIYDAVASKWVI